MFVKKCFACKSSAVNVLKSSNNWKSMHQFCSKCGKDQTKRVLAVRKATVRAKTAPKRAKRRVKPSSLFYSVGLILGAILTTATAFAFSEPLEYIAPRIDLVGKVNKMIVPETIGEKVERISDIYDVNPKEIAAIIQCESHGSTTVQSNFTGRKGRERSFGLAQIHISVHDVTYEQAIDPEFSIDFLAKHWSKGHKSMWYNCSRKLKYI